MLQGIGILGISAGTCTAERNVSGVVVIGSGEHFLVDCGDGSLQQLMKLEISVLGKIGAICITHMHGDHVFGLPAILTWMSINRREKILRVIGPATLRAFVESTLKMTDSWPLGFDMEWVEDHEFQTSRGVSVQKFPITHRIDCFGYQFTDHKGHRIVILGDLWHDGTAEAFKDILPTVSGDADVTGTEHTTDILYHEATFATDRTPEHIRKWGHSTALEAGLAAKHLRARKLVLGHFSARYKDKWLYSDREGTPMVDAKRNAPGEVIVAKQLNLYYI